ncbi:hypothetical protein EBZ39_09890 [bacterium]|nr:hypothetical protein [bacterium]
MKIKDSALKALIAEVEAEIGDLLKSEKQKLSKAAEDLDEMSAAPEADPSAEASSEASAPMEDEQHEESQDSEDHAAPEASAPMEDEQKDAMKPEDDMAEAAPMDPEALKAEYMKLPQDELEMHLMAAKAAMMEMSGGQADAKAPAAPRLTKQNTKPKKNHITKLIKQKTKLIKKSIKMRKCINRKKTSATSASKN